MTSKDEAVAKQMNLAEQTSLGEELKSIYGVAYGHNLKLEQAQRKIVETRMDHKARDMYHEAIASRWMLFVADMRNVAAGAKRYLPMTQQIGLLDRNDDLIDSIRRVWDAELNKYGLYVYVIGHAEGKHEICVSWFAT
jgi:hypothetical protein